MSSGFTPTEYETLYKLFTLKKTNPKEYKEFWEFVEKEYIPQSHKIFVAMMEHAKANMPK